MLAAPDMAAIGERPYSCSECSKSFRYSAVLLRHQCAHGGDQRFRCLECGERCAGVADLRAHRRTHAGQTLYICTECGQSFSQSTLLDLHLGTHRRRSRNCPCRLCGRRFPHVPALLLHRLRQHPPEKPDRCPLCARSFRQSALPFHLARAHPPETTPATAPSPSALYHCTQCPRAFHSSAGLRNHSRIHVVPSLGDPGAEAHQCGVCGKSFSKSSTLTRHLQRHSGEKPFKCPECGKGFLESATLVRHKRTHTGEKPYACSDCGRCFSESSTLLRHQRSHQGERPHVCDTCGKGFGQRYDLVVHQRSHTGERPFPCPECGRGFTDRSDLTKHLRTHTGEKPYHCELCGKRFTCISNLNVHLRNHAGHKPHKCPECGKSFSVASKLALHKKTHLGERTAECTECGNAALHENPDIIIATPGRLVHVVVEMNLKLHSVEYVVFDEADRLFEMGFAEQIQEIIGRLPGDHQTVLFSATLPKLLVEFARAGLTEPILIRLDVDTKLSEHLKTSFFLVREDSKAAVLLHLLRSVVRPQDQTVVFVATRYHAEFLTELLTSQGLSCTHIYSSLDQAARKINLARFTHNKCSTLIVTDLAARGLDIPLLDNAINYSFPAKGKVFLHRVGRVARAGRRGTAYSLVAPDEVPYLLDLYLFLGRCITLAQPHEVPSGTVGSDGVLGQVPQSVVDEEDSCLQTTLDASLDLRGLHHVVSNAQQQYVRCRPAPSPESVRRAKELDLAGLGLHPLFCSRCEEGELQLLKLVDSIRNYGIRSTIFEINSSSRNPSSQMMRAKRHRDQKAITSFHQGRQERQESLTEPFGLKMLTQREEREENQLESVKDIFSEVYQKQPRPGHNQGAKRRREEARHRDREFYVPYRPRDFNSERGLSVSGTGGAFEQQVTGAVLDLMGDEAQSMSQGRKQLKWDRKKKRFVGQSGQEDKRKIKTESGRYINSSYKGDLYQKWKQKQKIDDQDSDEDGPSSRQSPRPRRGGKRGRSHGESQTRAVSAPAGRARSELKTKEQILKQRRQAQKQHFLQRGGLKQLSARNRQRVQELRQGAFGRGAPSRKGKMRKRM